MSKTISPFAASPMADDCLCGSSRSNFLSHRYSAESVEAKGTAAHCEDSESKSSHCDSSHRKSSKGEQKSHGQSAKGENSCGDPAKREDARCDSAQGKNAGRDVPDRDDPFCTTVLLSGDPSSDIDVYERKTEESPAALVFVMPGIWNIVDFLYRRSLLAGTCVSCFWFCIFCPSAYEFIYGYLEQVSKQHQFIHLRSRNAEFPFRYSLAGDAKL